MRKKIVIIIFFLVYALIWIYNDILSYGYMQAKGQWNVIYNSIPIKKILENSTTSQETKSKILLMQEVRQFAIDSLGLSNSNNYNSYFDQKGKDILWNLSACEPYEFKATEWEFPLLGTFSYKGYFDLDKAKSERKKLDSIGLDTRIRTVSAWSTLGWFNDPILSSMLKRNTGSIAELIIHELTHSTVFVKDSLIYNENLASFIGKQGAIMFLISKYGKESSEYKEYRGSEGDYVKYTHHMLRGYKALDSLYLSFSNNPVGFKNEKKQLLIQKIVTQIDTITFHNKERFKGIFKKNLPNNAYFQSYERYHSKLDEFEQILKDNFEGNLNSYVYVLKLKWQ